MMRWLRRRSHISSKSPTARRHPWRPLHLEFLEDRRTPAFGLLAGPDVTYHGGPLLQNAQVQAVYDGSAWGTDPTLQQEVGQLDGFLNYFVGSPYMDVLSQYNVGHGATLADDMVGQNLSSGQSVSDSQIRATLNAEITSGHAAAPGPNSLYVVFTPPGVVVTDGGQNSATGFAGYHDTFTDSAGQPVYYAVVPYPNGGVSAQRLSVLQQATVVLSHEVSEAVTDPDTQTGWYDPRLGEIGDIAEGKIGVLNGFAVQAVWSQADGQSVIPTGSTTAAPSTAQVAGAQFRATAGTSATGVVATITGTAAGATAADFTATIDWGDGTTSTGTVVADPNGGFDVTGTKTYTQAGLYPITVTVGGATGTVVGTALGEAAVAPAPPTVVARGTRLTATAGTQFSGVVATFTDVNPGVTAGSFTATIDWGDGTTSTGTVVADPKGGFDVTGTHTFTGSGGLSEGGLFGPGVFGHQFDIVRTTVTDTAAGASAVAFSLADVAPVPPAIAAKGVNITATSGQPFSGTVATFTAKDTTATAGSFTATIDWGDGTTSTGAVVADPKSGFDVTGTHTYTNTLDGFWAFLGGPFGRGTQYFPVHVSITDTQTNDQATARSLAAVAPAPPAIALAAQNLTATSGQQFSGTVATFTDSNTGATAGNFTAVINWGDGTVSQGTVVADPKGGFDVTGSHTYSLDSEPWLAWNGPPFGSGTGDTNFVLTVAVKDTTTDDRAISQSLADVTPAPAAVTPAGTLINAVIGQQFTGTVATFTATDTTATAGGFTATINWGDGSTSTGTVAADPNGGFDVTGSHTYTADGDGDVDPQRPFFHGPNFGGDHQLFPVTVTITATADNSSATAVSLADVTPTPPAIVATSLSLAGPAGKVVSGTVATFTDTNAGASGPQGTPEPASFSAAIAWGDGKVSPGTVTADPNGGFDVTGSHTYSHGGTFPVFVVIHSDTGDTGFALGSAVIADPGQSASIATVAAGIAESGEADANLVAGYYRQYLGRTGAASEVAFWVSQMQQGMSDNQVLAGFLNSPEFFARSGGTTQVWLGALYRNLLNRTAGASEVAFWLGVSANGTSNSAIAMGFLNSPERQALSVQNAYQQYLGRTAGASEVSFWVSQMRQGMSDQQLAANFVGSAEYFQTHNANASD